MLAKQFRLRRGDDIALVRKQGKQWRHPLIVLLIHKNELTLSRFGFVTSRSIGNAIVRNRVKRLLREVIRIQLHTIPTGYDCLFIARKYMVGATYAETETAVQQLLKRAGLQQQ